MTLRIETFLWNISNIRLEKFDAMGNKIESKKKAKKLTASELRKKKKYVQSILVQVPRIYH
jgi:hypothetical protein